MTDKKTPDITVSWYLPMQMLTLILHYGNIVEGIPTWVIWFPSIVWAFTIVLTLFIMAMIGLAIWIKERMDKKW